MLSLPQVLSLTEKQNSCLTYTYLLNKPINTNIHCSGHLTHRYEPVLCTIVCICDGTPEERSQYSKIHYLLSKSYHTDLQDNVKIRVQDQFGTANKLLD
jgi:hypothetical protein